MEMVKKKLRSRSVSDLLDWRGRCKGIVAEKDDGGGIEYLSEDREREPETRRRKRSGTWP